MTQATNHQAPGPETIHDRVPNRELWVRLLYMIFCTIAWSIAEFLLACVAIFQFLAVLVNGAVHERALRFGRNATVYATQLFDYLTFNSEQVPFPFADWPDEAVGDGPWRAREPAAATGAPQTPVAPTSPEDAAPDATAEAVDTGESNPVGEDVAEAEGTDGAAGTEGAEGIDDAEPANGDARTDDPPKA